MRKLLIIALGLPPLVFTAALIWYAVTRPTAPPKVSFLHCTEGFAAQSTAAFATTNHSPWPVTIHARYVMQYSAPVGWTNHEALWCTGDWTLQPGEGFLLTAAAPATVHPWRAQFACSKALSQAERTLIFTMAHMHLIDFARRYRPIATVQTEWIQE